MGRLHQSSCEKTNAKCDGRGAIKFPNTLPINLIAMSEFLSNINEYISSQPWYLIAGVTALVIHIFLKKINISVQTGIRPPRTFQDQLRSTIHPFEIDSKSFGDIKLFSNQVNFNSDPDTNI